MTVQTVITIFNASIGADRREFFIPTVIDSASFFEQRGASSSKGIISEHLDFKIRIPSTAKVQENRSYIAEARYKALSSEEKKKYWTLRKSDYVLIGAYSESTSLTQQELNALVQKGNFDLIRIQEYADNTIRGSDDVKHWRIGGV